jgi:hypothetical protein
MTTLFLGRDVVVIILIVVIASLLSRQSLLSLFSVRFVCRYRSTVPPYWYKKYW